MLRVRMWPKASQRGTYATTLAEVSNKLADVLLVSL